MNEKHPQHDWWLSVRDDHTLTDAQRRSGDILFGVITLFRFPKTYYKLRNQRYASKRHHGLKDKAKRLSWRLHIDGPRAMRNHFTPYYKTVRAVVRWNKMFKHKRRHAVREYGRRHALIIGPRIDRHVRKYGPLGG